MVKFFSKSKKTLLSNSLLLTSSLLVVSMAHAGIAQFNPAPLHEQIIRPGTGFQDPVRILPTDTELENCIATGNTNLWEDNTDELAAAGLLSGSMYVRVMWQYIEPNNNDWQFDRLDKLLQCANKRGQAVDLRIMLTSPTNDTYKGLPTWLNGLTTDDGVEFDSFWSNAGSLYSYRVPDFTNPVLEREHTELIQALGARFDGHKDLNSVDIGSVGQWGEWHYLGYPTHNSEHINHMPHPDIQEEIIQLYIDSFPTTPLVALEGAHYNIDITSAGGNTHYTSKTANFLRARPDIGWRGDSWGETYFNDRYNCLVFSTGVECEGNASAGGRLWNTWKTGMVSLEISGKGMYEWPEDGIYDPLWRSQAFASNWHVSTINSKLGSFPPTFHPRLQDLSAVMGYRLALQQATFDSTPSAGSNFSVSMDWQNFGRAPIYRNFVISFRLKDTNGNVIFQTKSDKSLKGITGEDGLVNMTPDFYIPSGLAGSYTLETALVFNGTNNGVSYENDYTSVAPIAIEVEDRLDDKWVKLGSVEISAGNSTGGSSSPIPSSYLEVVVPSNQDSAGNIIDGNTGDSASSWYNTDGIPADAHFEIKMGRRFKLTSLNYIDASYRNLEITIFDGSQQVSAFNVTHQGNSRTNGTMIPINNGDGVLATSIKIRNPVIYGTQSWIAPVEVTLSGIQAEADYHHIEPGNENSLTASDNADLWRITDGKTTSGSWNNKGLPNEAHVDLYLDKTRKIFAVTYEDAHPRKLIVGIWNNGQLVSTEPFNTQAGYNELQFANVVGNIVKVWSTNDYLSGGELWIAPKEIKVHGFAQ